MDYHGDVDEEAAEADRGEFKGAAEVISGGYILRRDEDEALSAHDQASS